jgi:cytochrome P450
MNLPDGPKTSPFLQQIQALFCPLKTLDDWAEQYGDTFRLLGNQLPPLIYFSSPQALQTIFTADPDRLSSVQKSEVIKPLLGEHSIIFLDGNRHQRQRRLLIPPFHGDRMREYGQLICAITQEAISQWTPGKLFVVRQVMKDISLRVILTAVFGLQKGPRYEQLRQLLNSLFDIFDYPLSSILLFFPLLQQDLGPWSPWGRFLRQQQQIDQLVYTEIVERRAQGDFWRKDMLSLLLSATDEAGQPMTDAELRDNLLTLVFAGYETTAAALTWALYWSHYLPEVQEKLLRELGSLSLDSDLNASVRLPYLTAVCQETLRLYPIAISAFARVVQKPFEVIGYQLEPGTIVNVSIYLAHQREVVYPEPKQFKPERFLERQFSPYEYLPFGGGDRCCIGAALAQFEMKLVLATILSRLQLALVNPRPLKPIRRGITMVPPNNLQMVVNGVRHTTPNFYQGRVVG